MTQRYEKVVWQDETTSQQGTLINAERLDQMQTAHHFADGFEEVDTVPTANPGVDYHKVVYCTADSTFYRWDGTQWTKDIDDDTKALLEAHIANHSNPHVVTKAQVGLGNCDNTSDLNKPISTATQTALDGKLDDSQIVSAWQGTPDNSHIPGEKLTKDALDTLNTNIGTVSGDLANHVGDKSNPHAVTKAQVGLGNADNTADLDKPISTATQTALDGKVSKLESKPTAGTYTKITINDEGQVTGGSNPTTLAGYGITDAVQANAAITGATKCKITYDNKGLITGGADLSAGDIPSLDWSKISTGKPTTLAGYGITDAVDTANAQTVGGAKTFTGQLIATGQRAYDPVNTNDIATVATLDAYSPMVRTTGNQFIEGTKQFQTNWSRGCTSANVVTTPSTNISATIFSLVDQMYDTSHNPIGNLAKVRNASGQNYIDLNNISYGYSEGGIQKRIDAFIRVLVDETTGDTQVVFYRQKRNADGTGVTSTKSKVIASILYEE